MIGYRNSIRLCDATGANHIQTCLNQVLHARAHKFADLSTNLCDHWIDITRQHPHFGPTFYISHFAFCICLDIPKRMQLQQNLMATAIKNASSSMRCT